MFQIHCSSFKQLLKDAMTCIGKKGVPCILDVNLHVEKDVLTLETNNFDRAAGIEYSIVEHAPMSAAVNAKQLKEALAGFDKNDLLAVSKVDSEIRIEAAGGSCSLAISDHDRPLSARAATGTYLGEVTAEQISTIAKRAMFADASYDSSSVLGSIHLESSDKLRACATDGSRLVSFEDEKVAGEFDLNIPTEHFDALVAILASPHRKKQSHRIQIWQQDISTIFFKGVNFTMKARLCAGQYPKYAELFPVDFLNTLEFDTKTLLKAVKQVAKAADDRTHLIKFEFNGACHITAVTPDEVKANAKVDYVSKVDGFENKFAINANYFLACLEAATEKLYLGFNGPLRPLVFTDSERRTKHLIMPIQAK